MPENETPQPEDPSQYNERRNADIARLEQLFADATEVLNTYQDNPEKVSAEIEMGAALIRASRAVQMGIPKK